MKKYLKQAISSIFGFWIAFVLAACGGGNVPNAAPESISAQEEPVSALVSRPLAPNRASNESLPQICNCVLPFDHISIEQGLSQSSVRVIFQDSRGFLWFGTEDGLNRYDGYTFKSYKPEPSNPNSISNGWINTIVEDQGGYLWVGTSLGGLNRYDPFKGDFTQYQHIDGQPTSVIDNHISALLVDKDNRLWIGTLSGLDRFDSKTGAFHHYPYAEIQPKIDEGNVSNPDAQKNPGIVRYYTGSTQSDKLSSKNVSTIYQDSLGHLWIGTSDAGLNLFDEQLGKFTVYQYFEGGPLSGDIKPMTISSNRITAITENTQGKLWVGTNSGLNLFNPETAEFKRFLNDEENPQSLMDNSINTLFSDSTGNLWIGTANGLDRLNEDFDHFTHYSNDPSFPKSLSNNYIISIYEDRGGVLWFGTYGGGVNKYDRADAKFAYYRNDPNDPKSLSGNFIFPIHVDKKGLAWIGTSGGGVNRFNWRTGENVRFVNDPDNPNSLGSNSLLSIFEDSGGLMWFGTTKSLDSFDPRRNIFTHYTNDESNPESISSNRVYTIHEDDDGQLWFGTSIGLDRFDKRSGVFTHYRSNSADSSTLSGNKVYSIHEDDEGNLWVGTAESGLNRMDLKTNTFTRYRHDSKDGTSISSDSILSVYQDTKGRLWVGTGGGGLNLYHPETDSFTVYLEKDGLPNGFVYGILEDDKGHLWMSTNFGISRFDPETNTFRNFNADDGLQSNEFDSFAYAKGMDGEFYFGGINGLTVFHPSKITDNPYVPQITLTSLTQDDQPITLDSSVETAQEVTLEWPQNSLEFEFAGLSYNQPNKNRYAYMLEGFDTNWHFIGTKRSGRYTNIPGGKYTLLLKATNSDGVWNETPARLNVTVIPPYWQTVWFRALLSFAAVAVIFSGVKLRTKSIQDRNRALERLVQERTHALEKRGRELEALYQADEKILRNVSLNQVFQTLVDVAVDLLHADRSVVFAWDEEQTKVRPRVSHGYSARTLKVMEFARGEGNVGQVLATGKSIIARELEPETMRPDVREAIIAEGIKSFVHIPIVVDQRVVAVFNVAFTRPDFIGEDIMRLFSALTDRASLSIANMELFEQTKDLAVMEERSRLARDLHDSAKQKAFAALAQLGTARGILNGNGHSVAIHLNEAENLVSDVIQELTFLVQEIYPIALQEKGLATALREYIFEWENRNDSTAKLSIRNERRLPLEIEQAIYRVTQESLANVARHSKASRVDIALVYNTDSVQLSLADDGCGFDADVKSHGMGLRSIRERVSSVHGVAQIQSAPGHGTRILVQIPVKVPEGAGNGKQSS
ncbi:MAG TPA: two-component regulator propeller domain-containing protein [Anaerolineales bacterium]|nr:two-component regulator propeller domain-containing protein [Anaerolineales bacterium]